MLILYNLSVKPKKPQMKVIINNNGGGIYSTMAIFALESPVASALISLLPQLYNTSPHRAAAGDLGWVFVIAPVRGKLGKK